MASGGNSLSRDPNVCASCSSIADGMLDELVQAAVMKIAADQEADAATEAERGNGPSHESNDPHEPGFVRIGERAD